MKILYDYEIFANQKYGGISRYFYEIIQRLVEENHSDIFLFQGSNVNEYDFHQFSHDLTEYYSWARPNVPKFSKFFSFLNLLGFEIYSWRRSDIDIYHPTYYPKIRLGNQADYLVVTVHDLIHELYPHLFNNSKKINARRESWIKAADLVITVSQNTRDDLLDYYEVNPGQVKTIYHSSSLPQTGLSEGKIKIESPYILYVGKRGSYKNFINLLKAYVNDKEITSDFKLVCFGGKNFNKKEKELIKKNDLFQNVIHISGGDDHKLAKYYWHASLFVCPSIYEGFGIPLVEAMKLETPVAASNRASIPEVLDGSGALFDPEDVGSIHKTIKKVLYDEKFKGNLIEKGLQRANDFSWSKTARRTLQEYEALVKKP